MKLNEVMVDLDTLEKNKNMYYKYLPKNKKERRLLKDNVSIEIDYNYGDIFFSISKKQYRKIKISVINNNVDFRLLKNIINKSKKINYYGIVEAKLSYELSKSIDEEILKKLNLLK